MLRKLAIALATTFLGSRDTDTGLNLLICMSILVVAVVGARACYSRGHMHVCVCM